ncbi:3-oxoacyl-[acyl-carrier protein] reductase [Duganella sp. CF517]|uniref:3-oxoacyl-ACP reductase n=1 Tax=Duganella sp. CF517 TaxID=1881038 RepID=UPI0008AAC03A|nr:3-oxoacyl-ACP reductase [Duganella sp. CF517]SEN76808.1 3-oxoacyl-[acyl-carrier protein] reductase [Duganella sp. CF517]
MSDLLMRLNANPLTGAIAKAVGLPNPVPLAREAGPYVERPFDGKRVLLCRTAGGYAAEAMAAVFARAGTAALDAPSIGAGPLDIVAMDATGCVTPQDYRGFYDGLHPIVRQLARNARVLILAADPGEAATPVAAAVARGVEGFVRSLAKEVGAKGITVNLGYVARDALDRLDGPLRFFCGARTTYVTGQAFYLGGGVAAPSGMPSTRVLSGKIALVTGAARGIGLAVLERLAQEGATVVALDVPAAAEALHAACERHAAVPFLADIAAQDSAERLADFLLERFGGIDIVVHNAGITRDRTLANMQAHFWDLVVQVNLAAVMAIDQRLLESGVLRDEGRIVCLSSVSGVAGNFGQTNYAASKAALIGYVAAQAPLLAARGICINAVAPGFIDTPMTDAMPVVVREIGRRLNSVKQSGQPRDVAELVAFLATPGAFGISGATLRVCGQGLIGA